MSMSSYLDKLISFLIFIGFSVFLVIPKGGTIILVILVLSIIGLFLNRNIKNNLDHWEKLLLFGFISYFLLVVLSNYIFHGSIRDIDTASRFVLVIPIYLYLRKANVHYKSLELGILLACILFGINSILPRFFDLSQFFQFTKHTGIVSLYGAIIGVTSLFLVSKKNSSIYNLIILVCAFFGIATTLLAGGRGVWISAFLSFIILFYLNPSRWSKLEKVLVVYLGIIFSLMGYLVPETGVKTRIDNAVNQTTSYVDARISGNSVADRLEMWRSSLYIFKENPIFGVGEGNFKEKNVELIEKGLIKKDIGKFNHPHGEFITTLVEQGLIGLGILLFLFSNPLIKCYKVLKNEDMNNDSNIPLVLVISLILHYIFYSITNGVFAHQNTTLFFAAFVTIGMGLYSSMNSEDKV